MQNSRGVPGGFAAALSGPATDPVPAGKVRADSTGWGNDRLGRQAPGGAVPFSRERLEFTEGLVV